MWASAIVAISLLGGVHETAIRADYAKQSVEDRQKGNIYYLTMPEKSPLKWGAVTALAVAQNSRALTLNTHIPQKITDSVYRINLRDLLWSPADFEKVLEKYPYNRVKGTYSYYIIRADWLVVELSDSGDSDAYNILLFSGKGVPKTKDEWLERLGINRKQALDLGLDFGLIETKSGVARHKHRYMTFYPTIVGYDTDTGDVDNLDKKKAPLEFPNPYDFKPDAKEYIVGIPKLWYRRQDGKRVGGRGALSVFTLANGAGAIQQVAPTKIVEDFSRFRDNAEIRYPGSCLSCHRTGLNTATENGLKKFIDAGVNLKFKKLEDRDIVERFHLTDESDYIESSNKQYNGAVEACTGMKSEEAIAEYLKCIKEYDADVTLEKAAIELYTTPVDLRVFITSLEAAGSTLTGLAAGIPAPREAWESEYQKLYGAMRLKAPLSYKAEVKK